LLQKLYEHNNKENLSLLFTHNFDRIFCFILGLLGGGRKNNKKGG